MAEDPKKSDFDFNAEGNNPFKSFEPSNEQPWPDQPERSKLGEPMLEPVDNLISLSLKDIQEDLDRDSDARSGNLPGESLPHIENDSYLLVKESGLLPVNTRYFANNDNLEVSKGLIGKLNEGAIVCFDILDSNGEPVLEAPDEKLIVYLKFLYKEDFRTGELEPIEAIDRATNKKRIVFALRIKTNNESPLIQFSFVKLDANYKNLYSQEALEAASDYAQNELLPLGDFSQRINDTLNSGYSGNLETHSLSVLTLNSLDKFFPIQVAKSGK